MNKDIKIRPAKSKDFTRIMDLLYQLWPTKTLNPVKIKKIFNKELKNPNNYYLQVAEHNKKIIGFISFSWRLNIYSHGLISCIEELIIDEKYRKKGIGGKMLKNIFSLCKKKKINCVYLTSGFHRTEAHKFYEKFGFKKTGFGIEKFL